MVASQPGPTADHLGRRLAEPLAVLEARQHLLGQAGRLDLLAPDEGVVVVMTMVADCRRSSCSGVSRIPDFD